MNSADEFFDAANLAEIHERFAEANGYYDKALELEPDFPDAYFNRASNWDMLGEYARAIADYQRVLSYRPDDTLALQNLVVIYTTAPERRFRNPKLALRYAKRACEACKYAERGPLAALAAAHAANGKFGKAIRLLKKAIELAAREFES